jgi:hypothetical protein
MSMTIFTLRLVERFPPDNTLDNAIKTMVIPSPIITLKLHSYPGPIVTLLLLGCLGAQSVVLVNIYGLPRIADPLITNSTGGDIATLLKHVLGEGSLLRLILVLSPTCQLL